MMSIRRHSHRGTWAAMSPPSDEPYHFVLPFNMSTRMKSALVQARKATNLSSEGGTIGIAVAGATAARSFSVTLGGNTRPFSE